jgi:DNA-binding transcriptional MerR regulator
MEATNAQPLQIGALAARTGLTVRTLRHYDEIGLLRPSERSDAGYRLYRQPEIRRLYRIVALRSLGVPLDQVAELLKGDEAEPRDVVRRHLAEVDRRIELQVALRRRLAGVLEALERIGTATNDDYLQAIERTTMIEKHYTPEQVDWLARRREELGDDAIRAVEDEWLLLFERMRAEMKRGADPSAPAPQEIAARMRELVAMFHGGNEGIRSAVGRVWKETPREEMVASLEVQGVENAEARIPEPELSEYIERAHAAAGEKP